MCFLLYHELSHIRSVSYIKCVFVKFSGVHQPKLLYLHGLIATLFPCILCQLETLGIRRRVRESENHVKKNSVWKVKKIPNSTFMHILCKHVVHLAKPIDGTVTTHHSRIKDLKSQGFSIAGYCRKFIQKAKVKKFVLHLYEVSSATCPLKEYP